MGAAGTPIATFNLRGVGTGPMVTYPSNSAVSTLGSGFNTPAGVAVDGSGDVFVADSSNNAVEEIVAGTGSVLPVGSVFSSPEDVAVDGSGNLFLVVGFPNQVQAIVAVNGAGSSASAVIAVGSGIQNQRSVAVDGSGNVFVVDSSSLADSAANTVKEIVAINGVVTSSSVVNTVASGLGALGGVAVDSSGNVFVADIGNNAVKEIVAVNGVVSSGSTVITVLDVNNPAAVALDGIGNIFFTNASNSLVQEVDRSDAPTFAFAPTPIGSTSADSPMSLLFANSGNQPLNAVPPGLGVGTDFAQVAGNGAEPDCTASFSLAPGQECNLSIAFTPQSIGQIQNSAVFFDNALNNSPFAIQVVPLTGTGTAIAPTITFSVPNQSYGAAPFAVNASSNSPGTFTYSVVTSLVGSLNATGGNATLTATVTPAAAGTYPAAQTGTVTFYDNGNAIGSPVTLVGGKASITTPVYTGSQSFTAVYSGDTNYLASPASNTGGLSFAVNPTITFTTAASYAYGQSFQLSAQSNSAGAFTYTLVSGPASVSSTGIVTVTGESPVTVQASEAPVTGCNTGSAQASFSGVKANSTTTLTATAIKSGYGSAATLSAMVAPQYSGVPTGSISFYDGGKRLATVPLSGGKASYTTGQLVGAQHSYSATYSGNSNFNISPSNTAALTIPLTAVNLTLVSSKLVYPLPPVYTVYVTPASGKPEPTGIVSLYDGTTLVATQTLYAATKGNLLGVVLPPLHVGQHTLTAVYSGDSNYAPGTSAPVVATVTAGPVKLQLSCASDSLKSGQTLSCLVNADESVLPCNRHCAIYSNRLGHRISHAQQGRPGNHHLPRDQQRRLHPDRKLRGTGRLPGSTTRYLQLHRKLETPGAKCDRLSCALVNGQQHTHSRTRRT